LLCPLGRLRVRKVFVQPRWTDQIENDAVGTPLDPDWGERSTSSGRTRHQMLEFVYALRIVRPARLLQGFQSQRRFLRSRLEPLSHLQYWETTAAMRSAVLLLY